MKHTNQEMIAELGRHRTVTAAAAALGISPRTLQERLQKADLDNPSAYLQGTQARPEVDPLVQHREQREQRSLASEKRELLERLDDAERRFRFAQQLAHRNTELAPVEARVSSRRQATAIALASDWHVEESVDAEAVAGRNRYDLDVARQRAERFFTGVIWLVQHHRTSFDIDNVLVWLGGDLITGYIHEELEESNSLSPLEACLWLKSVLREGLRRVADELDVKRLLVPCSYGNHGRTTKKRRVKTGAANSYEWMLYHVLRDELASDSRIEFNIPKAAHCYQRVYDFDLHFHHGDEVRYWGGVGGLTIPLNKRVPKWDSVRPCHYHHIGHFHQLVDVGHTIVNGSLIGYSEYALAIGAEYEPPQQAFYLLDSRRGKCGFTPIWVDDDSASYR